MRTRLRSLPTGSGSGSLIRYPSTFTVQTGVPYVIITDFVTDTQLRIKVNASGYQSINHTFSQRLDTTSRLVYGSRNEPVADFFKGRIH